MSDEFDDLGEFADLERRLREAHAFEPRAGLRQEIRSRLRPTGTGAWAGLSAVAAVLVAAVGVGLLLHAGVLPSGSGGGGTAGSAARFGATAPALSPATADFGPLPAPFHGLRSSSGSAIASAGAAPAPGSAALPPGTALVYRLEAGRAATSVYRVGPAPSGARLLYVRVQSGSVQYLEPVYALPDGTVESALTPDELLPG